MSNPWVEIDDNRLTAGKWWTSELNFDLIRRDLGVLEYGFDFNLDEATFEETSSSTWQEIATVEFSFPQIIGPPAGDQGLSITWRLYLGFELKAAGGSSAAISFRITASGATNHGPADGLTWGDPYSYPSDRMWFEMDDLPATTTVSVEGWHGGGTATTYYAQRVHGEHGPDCYLRMEEG